MGEANQISTGVTDSRPFWKKKRWWVVVFVITLPFWAVGSVKLYRSYQFEKHKPEILAALNKLVMTDFSNQDDPLKPLPGFGPLPSLGRPWDAYVKCESKQFLNPYEEWMALKRGNEIEFLNRKLITLGGIDAFSQWLACQGLVTIVIDSERLLSVGYSRRFGGEYIKRPLWRRSLPFLYDWMAYSDELEILFADGRIQSIDFSSSSL